MELVSPALEYLDSKGVPYRLFTHAGPIHSLDQAASERGETPDQVVRSILFRLGEGQYAMALMPGPRQISWKSLRQYFKTNRLSLAPNDEVATITGYQIGTVNPFGLPQPMRILIDRSLMDKETVSLGSGIRGTAIILTPQSMLQAIPDADLIDLNPDQDINSTGK